MSSALQQRSREVDRPRIDIMGVQFDQMDPEDAAQTVCDRISENRDGMVITPNLQILQMCTRDSELAKIVDTADFVTADGSPIVLASKIAGTPLDGRVAGSSLMWDILKIAGHRHWPVAIAGGTPGVATQAAERIKSLYPGLTCDGFELSFGWDREPQEVAALTERLREGDFRIVFLGLGFPRQENLARQLKAAGVSAWFVGVGAGIDFAAGTVSRAPVWIQKSGLEWIFRLAQEPARLWRRYLLDGVPFACRLMMWSIRRRAQVAS